MATLSDERRERLADVAASYRDAIHTLDVQRRKLQDQVLAAVDTDKARIPEVARAIGVSPTRVYTIISDAYKR